jgi:tetratricopeptide (TPR) repeat protein
LGSTLDEEGKWAEAEVVHRKALASWRKLGGNEDPRALTDLEKLVRDLLAQQKNKEAEQVLDEVLTPAFMSTPAGADLLVTRIDLLGRLGRWQEAETNAILSAKYQPDDHYREHTLAALLVINHHRPEYEQLCQKILPQFADTKSPYIAERISGDCLLLPHSGVDLQAVDKLATKAVTIGKNDSAIGYFEACKALSDYRLGKLPEAVEWAGKSLNASQASARAKGFAVLAMAKWQLGQKAEARTVLAEGEGLAPSISATNGRVDLGDSWLAWLCAGIALDEAATLIQPATAGDANADKP